MLQQEGPKESKLKKKKLVVRVQIPNEAKLDLRLAVSGWAWQCTQSCVFLMPHMPLHFPAWKYFSSEETLCQGSWDTKKSSQSSLVNNIRADGIR